MPPSVVSKRNIFRKFLPSKRSRFTAGIQGASLFTWGVLTVYFCCRPFVSCHSQSGNLALETNNAASSTNILNYTVRPCVVFWVVGGSRKPFRGCAPVLLQTDVWFLPGLPCGRSDLKPNICPFQRGPSRTLQLVVARYAQVFRPETFSPWVKLLCFLLGTCKDRGAIQ